MRPFERQSTSQVQLFCGKIFGKYQRATDAFCLEIEQPPCNLDGPPLSYRSTDKEESMKETRDIDLALADGECYAGLILGKEGAPDHHLILLPGEAQDVSWSL